MTKSDPNSIWPSDTHFPIAIVFACLYLIPLIIQFNLTILKHKTKYFIPVFIGTCFEFIGYITRAISIKFPDQIPPYAVSSSLIVLAPLFIAAGNYLLLSRLCHSVLPSNFTSLLHIPLHHLTKIFITSDIVTFLIQVSGSGIASSGNWKGSTVKIGVDVLMAGLGVQLATILFFCCVVRRFHVLTRRGHVISSAGEGWRKILMAVYVSSGLIVIRSVYRLIEFALGINGYPFTHEWMFYTFESLPMLPAIGVFCLWHPGAYFGSGRKGNGAGEVELESDDVNV
ncbi:RTA1 like protein [Stipitochalara longipes BDJ]|nr:RTA1 like protein [Stipitochalara longipes BDJ]